jgi:hypothetical protein
MRYLLRVVEGKVVSMKMKNLHTTMKIRNIEMPTDIPKVLMFTGIGYPTVERRSSDSKITSIVSASANAITISKNLSLAFEPPFSFSEVFFSVAISDTPSSCCLRSCDL